MKYLAIALLMIAAVMGGLYLVAALIFLAFDHRARKG